MIIFGQFSQFEIEQTTREIFLQPIITEGHIAHKKEDQQTRFIDKVWSKMLEQFTQEARKMELFPKH